MAKPNRGKRQPGGGRPAPPAADAGMRAAAEGILRVARESPDGWGSVAEVLRTAEDEPGPMLEFLARQVGKECLPLLRGLALDADDDLAVAALGSLPLLGTRAAGEVLAEAYAAHPEGERGRLTRLGVEALQARGINVSLPEGDAPREAVAEFIPREAYETLPDACGVRESVMRGQDRYGVWSSVMVIWNDRAGVREGMTAAMSQREWTAAVEDHRRNGILMPRLPLDYVRSQIARARAINAKSGCPLEDNLEAWDRLAGAAAPGYEPPDPAAWVRALPAPRRAELVGQVGALLQVPGFESWGFEPADIRPWHAEWAAIAVDDDQEEPEAGQVEAVDTVLAAAVRGLVTPETAAMFRERLLELAYKLKELRRERHGEVAAAVAISLEGVDDYGAVPFFKLLAANSMDFLDQMLEAGDDPEAERFDPFGPLNLGEA
jgi:hypothetical protein